MKKLLQLLVICLLLLPSSILAIGLDFDVNRPYGTDTISKLDDYLRETRLDTMNFGIEEHQTTGKHKIRSTTTSGLAGETPTAGRIIYNTTTGALLFGSGTAWVSSNGSTSVPFSNIGTYSGDLTAALAALGTTNRATLVIDSTATISAHTTVASNIELWFIGDGKVTLGGYNLTLNGSINAGRNQIFDCSGAGRVLRGTTYKVLVSPEWWGAAADGTTNDFNAFTFALAFVGVTYDSAIDLTPGKVYLIQDNLLTIPAAVDVIFNAGARFKLLNHNIAFYRQIQAPSRPLFVYAGVGYAVTGTTGVACNTVWFPNPLPDAITFADGRETTVNLTTTSITLDCPVPATVTLKVPKGNVISIATTKTLTINGTFEAGLYQVFSYAGSGRVVFATGSVEAVYPEWWGAKVDGVVATGAGTNNVLPINYACAAYSIVKMGNGVYKVGAPGIILVGDQSFIGAGRNQTTIFGYRASVTDSFNLITTYNYTTSPYTATNQAVQIRGMSLYGKCNTITGLSLGPGFATYGHNYAGNGIALYRANGSTVEDIYLEKTSLNGILAAVTDEVTVNNCSLSNTGLLSYVGGEAGETVVAAANGISISGSTTLGRKVLISNCLVDTFRDVGMNTWSTSDVSFVNNVVIGKIATGVTTINTGGGVGFSAEGASGTAPRATFINCRHLNCNSTGFFLGSKALVKDCLVQGAIAGVFGGGFKISGDNVSIINSRVETQGAVTAAEGVVASMDVVVNNATPETLEATTMSGLEVRGCTFDNCGIGIRFLGVKDSIISGNVINCNSIADSYGIIYNAFDPADDGKYVANSVITGNKIIKAGNSGIAIAYNSYVTAENNTILGAASTAAFNIVGADFITIRNNLARKYEAGGSDVLVPYGVLFSVNPSSCQILDNVFEDYNNSTTTNPYGMTLTTTGTAAFVRHDNMMVTEETVNGKLVALAGSTVRTKAAGPVPRTWYNTDGATTWGP